MSALKVLPLAVALCAFALAAAADEKSRGGGGVEIKVGQERKVGGTDLRIAFERVAEDSRCPEGVQCVWAGNARARFAAADRKGGCVEFDLNTGVEPFEYRFGEHTIRLAKLAPHPAANRELKPGDYVATVVVSKTKK
jgi:hypothetical protein